MPDSAGSGEVLGLSAATATGSRVGALRALRDRLAREIEKADSSSAVASLSRSLVAVLEQIDTLAPPAQPKGTVLDELEAKRAARGPASAGVAASGGARKRG